MTAKKELTSTELAKIHDYAVALNELKETPEHYIMRVRGLKVEPLSEHQETWLDN